MANMKIGDEIKYKNPETSRFKKGTIFGVRKAEAKGREFVLSYLVDTGDDNLDMEGSPDRQPELIDVMPENIQAA